MNIRLSCNGKRIENAAWADIEAVLSELKEEADFSLTITPWPEKGAIKLAVESENGHYKPALLVNEGSARVFVNPEGRDKKDVPIGGYDCDAMSVTQDFALIVRMIKEFYETGDVSPDLLK